MAAPIRIENAASANNIAFMVKLPLVAKNSKKNLEKNCGEKEQSDYEPYPHNEP